MTSIKPDTGWSLIAPVGTPHTPHSDADYHVGAATASTSVYAVGGTITLPLFAAGLDVYLTANATLVIPAGADGQRICLRWWTNGAWDVTFPGNLDVTPILGAGAGTVNTPDGDTQMDYWEIVYVASLNRWVWLVSFALAR